MVTVILSGFPFGTPGISAVFQFGFRSTMKDWLGL